ncbi:MAG: PilZ domain-containing protein [Planctomycetota bacterium]
MSLIINCPFCRKQWFCSDADIHSQKECPFCDREIPKESLKARRVVESRVSERLDAAGCQIYIREQSLLSFLSKPEVHVCDAFDLSEEGVGVFLSEGTPIKGLQSGTRKVVIEGIFLDSPTENRRYITGPVQIPAEVRWVSGTAGDGKAGLKFATRNDAEAEALQNIIKILRDRAEASKGESPAIDPPKDQAPREPGSPEPDGHSER